MADEIGDRHFVCMRPLKWKCTNECRLLTSGEMEAVMGTKLLFQKSMEDLRAGLDNFDSGCGYVHHNVTLKSSDLRFSGCGGHPICCEFPPCSSSLRVIRSAAPHYPVLRGFLWRLYAAYKKHKDIKAIDGMLSSGSVEELIEYLGLQEDLPKLFSEDGEEHAVVSEDHSSPGLGCIETHLRVTHADLIAELQSIFQDDAEFPCCCCERLCRRTAVSCVDFSNLSKYQTAVWLTLKAHIQQNSGTEQLYICKYCQPFLNKNTMPARCVLNGLFTEPVPDELKALDALSKQLIQRAKAFQTIVRLGTYSGKVPSYNALQACRGTMFFLPLPLNKTLETLSEIHDMVTLPDPELFIEIHDMVTLPDPELFIILNGVPTKNKVVWQTLVDINVLKLAIHKLK